jgi:hypothetical protein
MINPIRDANALQPAQAAGPQLGGREVVQLRQGAQPILLRALDQARADQNAIQRRLERQVQDREEALFNAAHENVNLNGRLNEALRQANEALRQAEEQRNRANGLDEQLAAERLVRNALRAQLAEVRVEGNLLRAEVENHQRLKEDIQRRLDASEVRIGNLERQIVDERAAQVRLNRLNELRVQKVQLERKISEIEANQNDGELASGIGGLLLGGPIGMMIGFWGAVWVGGSCPCGEEKNKNIEALNRVKTEMAEIDPSTV